MKSDARKAVCVCVCGGDLCAMQTSASAAIDPRSGEWRSIASGLGRLGRVREDQVEEMKPLTLILVAMVM